MAFLNDRVLDQGLTILDTEADRIYLCSQQPATYAEATSTYALGNVTGIAISAPADGTPDGRAVTVSAASGGSITASGTATHYAIVDSANSRLLASSTLTASQAVTSGNTFALGSFSVRFPDVS